MAKKYWYKLAIYQKDSKTDIRNIYSQALLDILAKNYKSLSSRKLTKEKYILLNL